MTGPLAASIGAVAVGDTVLTTEIYPVANVGKVRVTYNWLYSALNCDPQDPTTFAWHVIGQSPSTIALSPLLGPPGMTLYASVRPDNGYQAEVQAPGSAHWITRVQGDETLGLTELGLLTVTLAGVNAQLLAVDSSLTGHDGYSGYLLHSTGSAPSPATTYFLAVLSSATAQIQALRYDHLSADTVMSALQAAGAPDAAALKLAIDASVPSPTA